MLAKRRRTLKDRARTLLRTIGSCLVYLLLCLRTTIQRTVYCGLKTASLTSDALRTLYYLPIFTAALILSVHLLRQEYQMVQVSEDSFLTTVRDLLSNVTEQVYSIFNSSLQYPVGPYTAVHPLLPQHNGSLMVGAS